MHHSIIFNVCTMWNKRPPGAHRIGSILRDQGWNVEVLDWTPFFSLDELKEFCRRRINNKTVFIGFSCFFGHWDDTLDNLTTWCKQEYPHVKIVLGMASVPRMNVAAADYYIYGFGENAILTLVQSFIGNTPIGGIKLDPKYFGSRKKVINANDFYPSFPMKSLMIKYEDRDYLEPSDWLGVEFSRGCMFECLYCNFPVLGVKADYSRDADDYILQLQDAYDRFGIENYYIADETFNDRSEKIIKFADVSDRLNFRPTLSGFLRADLLVSRPQDWEHLLKLGVVGHFYGVESFNHKTAKSIGKGMHPQRLKDGLIQIKEYFKNNDRKLYRGNIALIVGLPYETKEDLFETRDWICKNWEGESVDFSPLEIPYDEYNDKLSKLSKKWEEYGYVDQANELISADRDWIEAKHSLKNLNWKNDQMDLNYAIEFCSEVHNQINDIQGLHNFSLDFGSLCNLSQQEIFNSRRDQVYKILENSWKERLERYKSKKI